MVSPVSNLRVTPTAGVSPKKPLQLRKPKGPDPSIWQHRLLTGAGSLPLQRQVLDNPTYHNKITMHDTADESMDALLDAIKTAKSSFYVETFIWHNDEAGKQVAQALIDRKKQAEKEGKPFDAKVLIDYGGSHDPSVTTNDPAIVDFMRQNGIDVRYFNKAMVNPLATGRSPITHRKLYIQDGSSFLTGGRNIGNEYLKSSFRDPKGDRELAWHDLLLTVEGDETGRVLDAFFTNWVRSGGKMPEQRPTVVPSPDGKAIVQSFMTNPLDHTHGILDAQVKAIGAAKSSIRVVYPYFSDDSLVTALVDAKKKNPKLDIKVMIPGRDEGGTPGFLFSRLNDHTASLLIEAGIEVRYLTSYKEGGQLATTFSHLKALVIDKQLLSVGSANGDARTMRDNHELNTLIFDPDTAQDYVEDVLDDDWNRATPVTMQSLQAKHWWDRLIGWVLQRVEFLL